MAIGSKYLPQSVNVDLHESLMTQDVARYIKNLVYSVGDTSDATIAQGGQSGAYKPLPSNALYIENLVLPEGYNLSKGYYSSKETKEVLVALYNDRGNHTLYKLNGYDQTYNIISQGPIWNFQPQPEYSIHQGASALKIVYVTNPDTGEKVRRSYWMFTDGYNPQRFICLEDAIATNGFDPNLLGVFAGDYDHQVLINMGVPTPEGCINITEVTTTQDTIAMNNQLLYKPWQFRIRWYDVWGRPSEYGTMSDLYIPGGNDCINSSSGLPRCLDLSFDAPPPHINQVEIAYRNCNDQQWYTSKVLDLYSGSQLGAWWLRQRNPNVNYNSGTNKITYRFCADDDCKPISPSETNRLYNPMPRTSQSVATIGEYIGLGNNKDGFVPFTQELKDKIKVTVEPPSSKGATNEFRNINVWIAIYNPAININQPIFQQGINDASNIRYGFGAFNTVNQYRAFFAYQQYFPNAEQKGFIGYLRGTGVSAISKQYFLRNTGELIEIEDFTGPALVQFYPSGIFKPNGVFLQKFEFSNVPKGQYIFSVAGHQSEIFNNTDYQKTSTYTSGLYPLNRNNFLNPIKFNIESRVSESKEVVINVCENDYDGLNGNEILVVFDLCFTNSDIEQGYVLNTNVAGKTQYGVELLEYKGGDYDKTANFTDHNGFFFSASTTRNFGNYISGYCKCVKVQLFPTFTTGNNNNAHAVVYKYLNESNSCTDYEFKACNQILINGRVKICGSDIGVSNAVVVLTRGKSAVTDENGNFTLIASDDVLNSTRIDKLYYITSGCSFNSCDNTCVQPIEIKIFKCVTCEERVINVADTSILFQSAKGLLSGATYPVGVVGWDWLKRPTFVQSLGNLNIPSVSETKLFSPSRIRVDIVDGAVFPPETTSISFWIGSPADIANYVTWIVDKVEFIDNSGSVNEIAPTQIKIYYASLIEYNKQNEFNTTVNWQFIPENGTDPVTTDKVQFWLNGDGTFFDRSITSLVKYAKDGQYFLVNYTNDLKNLKENAIIRLVRPKACDTIEPYYELCSTVKIIDRSATINSFYLNAFDTYYLNRQIPVPVTEGEETDIQLRILGVPFEHNSPSDFWGEGCRNVGRVNIENPQESEVYHEEQVALSAALSETGLLNFLNYFEDSDTKKINFNEQINGIVALIPQPGVVFVLGQSNYFTVGYGDNIARVNADGTVGVASGTGFGRPERKLGDDYGCLLRDKLTISTYEGKIVWLDTVKAALMFSNYSDTIPLSKNGADSYIRPKVKYVAAYNLQNNNNRYFIGIINPISFEYLLTDFIFGKDNYVNNERQIDFSKCETLVFGLANKDYKGARSYCPELFAFLEGDKNNQQLFSFKNGQPYYHYNAIGNASYNTFYGVKCNRVFRVVMVVDNLKKKKFLSFGVYCTQSSYFADQIKTEANQLSRTLIDYLDQAEYFWSGPILCDLNTPSDPNNPIQTGENVLLDGNMLYGTWIDIRFIGDPAYDDQYSELEGVIGFVFPSEKSGT